MTDGLDSLRSYVDSGSQEAFAAFVREHVDLVYSTAVRRVNGDAHLAKDISQQVFCAAARQARSLCRHPMLSAWLFKVTRYQAASLLRGEHRRLERESARSAQDAIEREGTEPDWSELAPSLERSIDELGEADRTALLLRFFEGLSFADVGARLRVSEDGARSRVDRAVEKLRVKLQRRGVTSTAACLATALGESAVSAAPAGLAASVSSAAVMQAGAVAGGASAAGTGLLHLMTTTKVALIVGAVAAGSGFYCAGFARDSRERALAAGRRADVLRRELMQLDDKLASMGRVNAALNDRLAKDRESARLAQAERDRQAAANDEAQRRFSRALWANPDYVKLRMQMLKAENLRNFPRVDRALNLPPNVAARLDDIREQATEAVDKFGLQMAAEGKQGSDPGVVQGVARINDQLNDAIRTVLGDDGFARLQALTRTGEVGNLTDSVAVRVFDSGTPLNAAQGNSIQAILEANDPSFAQGKNFDESQVNWDGVVAQAQGVLPAAQVEALKSVGVESRANLQLQQLRSQLAQPAGGPK